MLGWLFSFCRNIANVSDKTDLALKTELAVLAFITCDLTNKGLTFVDFYKMVVEILMLVIFC